MSGCDSVNRNVFSRVRKLVRYSAGDDDTGVTSGGRQFVPHVVASNRKCSAANSGTVNRRLGDAVAAGSAKPSATVKVGNVSEWAME